MEVHALHQVPQGLRFKGGESRITNPPEKEQRERNETGEKVSAGEEMERLERRNRVLR